MWSTYPDTIRLIRIILLSQLLSAVEHGWYQIQQEIIRAFLMSGQFSVSSCLHSTALLFPFHLLERTFFLICCEDDMW